MPENGNVPTKGQRWRHGAARLPWYVIGCAMLVGFVGGLIGAFVGIIEGLNHQPLADAFLLGCIIGGVVGLIVSIPVCMRKMHFDLLHYRIHGEWPEVQSEGAN